MCTMREILYVHVVVTRSITKQCGRSSQMIIRKYISTFMAAKKKVAKKKVAKKAKKVAKKKVSKKKK